MCCVIFFGADSGIWVKGCRSSPSSCLARCVFSRQAGAICCSRPTSGQSVFILFLEQPQLSALFYLCVCVCVCLLVERVPPPDGTVSLVRAASLCLKRCLLCERGCSSLGMIPLPPPLLALLPSYLTRTDGSLTWCELICIMRITADKQHLGLSSWIQQRSIVLWQLSLCQQNATLNQDSPGRLAVCSDRPASSSLPSSVQRE